jgi:hypothetical protein
MNQELSKEQQEELDKIENRIAMIEDKAQDQLYIVLRRLANTFPNNYQLGVAIRKLVTTIN